MTGKVFSIEEFAPFDGPGIRTSVFFKGCPLRCSWCHNPEGQRTQSEILRSPNGCLGCGTCRKKALELTGHETLIPACVDVCPRGLIRVSGTDYTVEALCKKLLGNRAFYEATGGGVTFSGGEPLFQPVFLLACLTYLEGKLHRCVQTSGAAGEAVFAEMLQHTDYVLYDLKVLDEALFTKYTGGDIRVILRNFTSLAASGVPFTVRVPLIPTVTDTESNIKAICGVLTENGVKYAELLPYNNYAGAKYKLCGREYTPGFDGEVPVQTREDIWNAEGIRVKVL